VLANEGKLSNKKFEMFVPFGSLFELFVGGEKLKR
jgi:hypothetical protein